MPPEPLAEELIVELVEHPGWSITRRALRRWGEAGATLLCWGALKNGETLTSIVCQACDDGHFVELEHDSVSGTWRHYCGLAGFVRVDADDLVTYALDQDWLMSRLAELLSIHRLETACLIDGVMWRLGTARLGPQFWTAVLVRDVERHLNAILEQVQIAGRGHQSLLLSSTGSVPSRVVLRNDYRWLPLRQLLDADEGELAVREKVLMDALRIRKPDEPRGKAGRPGEQATLLAELRRRAEDGKMLDSVAAEARHLADWLKQSPRSSTRSPGRIETIIREAFNELKAEQPRTTK